MLLYPWVAEVYGMASEGVDPESLQNTMKTLLIPVDFSGSSSNVLKYAVKFSKDTAMERIVLMTNYFVSIYEQLLPSADFVQLSAEEMNAARQTITESLESIARKLAEECGPSIKVETAVSEPATII